MRCFRVLCVPIARGCVRMLVHPPAPAIAPRAPRLSLVVRFAVAGGSTDAKTCFMRYATMFLLFVSVVMVAACGGAGTGAAGTGAATSPDVLEIASAEQFDAELAKARPGVVVVADFHAEWCGPCKRLGPDLVALANANPGKLVVLKVDVDQHQQLAGRFQVESIPLLVKFADGKETARQVGYPGKAAVAQWLGL
jgi:thioredoxin